LAVTAVLGGVLLGGSPPAAHASGEVASGLEGCMVLFHRVKKWLAASPRIRRRAGSQARKLSSVAALATERPPPKRMIRRGTLILLLLLTSTRSSRGWA